MFSGTSGLNTTSSEFFFDGPQGLQPYFSITNSRFKSSYQQSPNYLLSYGYPFLFSYASYATDKKNIVGNIHEHLNRDCEKLTKSNYLNPDDISLKLHSKHNKPTFKETSFDNSHGAKLKYDKFGAGLDQKSLKQLEISLLGSNDNDNSSDGNTSAKGGSSSKKHGGSRKQSGSDNNSFINCLSCGLPCSKLDTECKFT